MNNRDDPAGDDRASDARDAQRRGPTASRSGAELLAALKNARLLAILRRRPDTVADARTLVALGVSALEVTLDTPGACELISVLRDEFRSDVVIGAGTVLTVDEVDAAHDAGAEFVVAPNVDPTVIRRGIDHGLGVLPGCATATEALVAARAGATALKLFPAGPLGIGYLRALRGPLADMAWVPTGGIGIDDVPDWLAAGAVCVGVGSAVMDDPDRLARLLGASR